MKKYMLLLLGSICVWRSVGQVMFRISEGTKLIANNRPMLVFDNSNLRNDGVILTLQSGATAVFTGDIESNISGTGKTQFDRIVLDKQNLSILSLISDMEIMSEIKFKSGLLDIKNAILNLGTSGVLTDESELSYAHSSGNGYIQVITNLIAPNSVNPGRLGAVISSSGSPGQTIVRRGNISAAGNNNSGNRFYEFIPATNTSLNATVRLQYLDAEINKEDEASFAVWQSINKLAWLNTGYDNRNTSLNYVEKKGVDMLHRFTLSASSDTYNQKSSLVQSVSEIFKVWPNPVRDNATVVFSTTQAETITLHLFDSKGSLIRSEAKKSGKGTNRFDLITKNLSPGNYTIQAVSNSGKKAAKFIKM